MHRTTLCKTLYLQWYFGQPPPPTLNPCRQGLPWHGCFLSLKKRCNLLLPHLTIYTPTLMIYFWFQTYQLVSSLCNFTSLLIWKKSILFPFSWIQTSHSLACGSDLTLTRKPISYYYLNSSPQGRFIYPSLFSPNALFSPKALDICN